MVRSYEWFRDTLRKYADKSEYVRGYCFDKKARVAYLLVYGLADKTGSVWKMILSSERSLRQVRI